MRSILTAVAALFLGGALWALEDGIDRWVRDLGNEDQAVRERAFDLLADEGERAREALEEASKSDDPEVAYQAKRLLKRLERGEGRRVEEPEEPQPPKPERRGVVRGNAMRIIIGQNGDQTTISEEVGGRVKVVERKNGETETFEAESREEFAKKHPEVAKRYGLDRESGLRVVPGPLGEDEEMVKRIEEMQREMEKRHQELIEKLREGGGFREFEQELEELLREPGRPRRAASNPLGASLAPVDEALRYQLDLEKGGLLVRDVPPDSKAAKIGLKKHDILLSLNGTAISGPDDVARALKADGPATAEVIRAGERTALKEE